MKTTLGSSTSAEVAAGSPSTLVIPLGSTEQHGPHLPLDTDTRIAEAVAARVVASNNTAWLGPTIAIGASGEHQGFAGTLSVGTEVLASMLIEIARTAGPEFDRIAVINAHGGNLTALTRAHQTCEFEGRRLMKWSVRLPDADLHAGRTETSLMLAIAPDLVRLDRAEAGVQAPLDEILSTIHKEGLKGVTPNGVLGDPTGATAEEGRELLEQLVADAAREVSRG